MREKARPALKSLRGTSPYASLVNLDDVISVVAQVAGESDTTARDRKTLARDLNKFRGDRKLSNAALAKKAGIDPRTLAKAMKGKHIQDDKTKKLEAVLDGNSRR